MSFFDATNGTNGDASLWNQFADSMNGNADQDITLYTQIAAPGAPTVAVNTTAGNLTGNYQYAIGFGTGYWQGAVGVGTFHAKGNTGGGTASATVSPNAQQVDLSAIPVGPTGVYERYLYRTQANGTTFYYLATLVDNTSTTYTDNIPDSGLGAAMPTTNTTGATYNGDAAGLTNIPAANLTGGPIPSAVLPPANSTTLGTVETAQNVASGNPIAVITNPASQATQSINGGLNVTDLSIAGIPGAVQGGRLVGFIAGGPPTSGTFEYGDIVFDTTNHVVWICTTAGTPGAWQSLNYLRTDSGAPNPQTVANSVTFESEITAAANITLSAAFLTASVLPNQTQIMQSTSTINGVEGSLFAVAEAGVAWKAAINANGDLGLGGGVYTFQGQLGSASGTWTPASGSLNVAVGTVINVASVPSGAKFFDTVDTTGQLNGAPNIGQFQMSGIMQSSGAAGQSSNSNSGNTGVWSASGISSTAITGSTVAVCDGTYYANGYYQLNGGYLQFVVTSIANTSNNVSTVKWGVA